MNVDTKTLVEDLRCAAKNTFIPWRPVARDAADTIERLERELAEINAVAAILAEQCEKLQKALRDECVYYRFSQWGRNGELRDGCNRCIQSWRSGTKERHAEGCLAAPKDAP